MSFTSLSAPATVDYTVKGTPTEIGIYICGRYLGMSGLASLGAHQFVLIIPERPGFPLTTNIGATTRGVVLGAYNINDNLGAEANAPSDVASLKSRQATCSLVNLRMCALGLVDRTARRVLAGYQAYRRKSAQKPIPYPKGAAGQFANACINSNSWAQSLIHHTIGPRLVRQDFPGFDTCRANLIDADYFR